MRVLGLGLFFALSLAGWAADEFEGRVQSEEGLLSIQGGSDELRNALLSRGNSLIQSLEKVVGSSEGKFVPVSITLVEAKGGENSVSRELLELPEMKNQLQLRVTMRFTGEGRLKVPELERTLLELLIYERGLRGRQGGQELDRVFVPPWIVEGLMEAIRWDRGQKDRGIYEVLARDGQSLALEKLLEQKEYNWSNPLREKIFRSSAGSLVMALLAQPGGKEGMVGFLSELPTFRGEQSGLIGKHFPGVNQGRQGLEKWWLLQIAAMAEAPITEALSPAETERRLQEILVFKVPRGEGTEQIDLLHWRQLLMLDPKTRAEAIRPAVGSLINLTNRSFPTYREAIAGYLEVLTRISQGNEELVEVMLGNLAAFRGEQVVQAERLEELLDWYLLSTTTEESGKFEDFLDLQQELEGGEGYSGDPVMEYVEKAERLFAE